MTAISMRGLHWIFPAPVAQWIERCPPEAEAEGSNPSGRIDAECIAKPLCGYVLANRQKGGSMYISVGAAILIIVLLIIFVF
jgi:hypothetical protein